MNYWPGFSAVIRREVGLKSDTMAVNDFKKANQQAVRTSFPLEAYCLFLIKLPCDCQVVHFIKPPLVYFHKWG